MPLTKPRRCESCNELKPAKQFLPSSLSPTGYIGKYLDCIKRSAARCRRSQTEPKLPTVPTAIRPLQTRMPLHLVRAASRFVAEYQPGVDRAIDVALEPELRDLLLWLRDLTLKEIVAPQTPEEIGRAILNYKDDRMARGITYGALWATLVRTAAIYAAQDDALGQPKA
jgi:hypothetical protein